MASFQSNQDKANNSFGSIDDIEAAAAKTAPPMMKGDSSSIMIQDLTSLQNQLYQHDPHLGSEQVAHILEEVIRTQKEAKATNKLLAIGLVATTLTGVVTTTYLSIQQSNNKTSVDALDLKIKDSSLSDAVVVQLNDRKEEEDDNEEGDDDKNRVVVGFVALEDVEQAWLDAQKGLTVTATITVENEDHNESLETVFTVDTTDAKRTAAVNGKTSYSNISTKEGLPLGVECGGDGEEKCKVFIPSDEDYERYLKKCTIL